MNSFKLEQPPERGLRRAAKASLLSMLMLSLTACGLFSPPAPTAQVAATPTTTDLTTTVPEFASAQAIQGDQAALLLRGLTAGQSVTLNGRNVLSGGASLHGNTGFVVNGNATISGSVSAATPTSLPAGTPIQCTDNARLNACLNGKPRTNIAALIIPQPSYNTMLDDYKPADFDQTISGNLELNSATDFTARFPAGSRLWVKGNVAFNFPASLERITLFADGNITFNGGVTLKTSVLLGQGVDLNGGSQTLDDSLVLAGKNLNVNTTLSSTGNTTLFAADTLTMNTKFGSTGQLALIAKQSLRLNSGTQASTKAVLWAGGSIELNGNSTLEGGLLAGGTIRANGSLELAKGTEVANADLPGYKSKINTTAGKSSGTLTPGGILVGLDGVKVEAPPELKETVTIIVERVNPTTISENPWQGREPITSIYKVYEVSDKEIPIKRQGLNYKVYIPFNNARHSQKYKRFSFTYVLDNSEIDDGWVALSDSRYSIVDKYLTSYVNSPYKAIMFVWDKSFYKINLQSRIESLALMNNYTAKYECIDGSNCSKFDFLLYNNVITQSFYEITRDAGIQPLLAIDPDSPNDLPYFVMNADPKNACRLNKSGFAPFAFYVRGSNIVICTNNEGAPASDPKLIEALRHEWYHGVQANTVDSNILGLAPRKWIIEATATLAEQSGKNIILGTRSYAKPRYIETPLTNSFGYNPYTNQDFWAFILKSHFKSSELSDLLSLFNQGLLDPKKEASKYVNGLDARYWEYTKNQAIEQKFPLRNETACQISSKYTDPVPWKVTYTKLKSNPLPISLSPYQSKTAEVTFSLVKEGKIKLKFDNSKLDFSKFRAVYYRNNNGAYNCDPISIGKNGVIINNVNKNTKLFVLVTYTNIDSPEGVKGFNLIMSKGDVADLTAVQLQAEVTKSDERPLALKSIGEADLDYSFKFIPIDGASNYANISLRKIGSEGTFPAAIVSDEDEITPTNIPADISAICVQKTTQPAAWNVELYDSQSEEETPLKTFSVNVNCTEKDPPCPPGTVRNATTGACEPPPPPCPPGTIETSPGQCEPTPPCTGPSCGPPPPPTPPAFPCCGGGGGGGGSNGDPHIRTFDGTRYSFQGIGEYVLARTLDRRYEVQLRFKQQGPYASSNAAVAMNVAGDKVGVYALGATGGNGGVGLLTVNGKEIPFTMQTDNSLTLPAGGRVFIDSGGTNTALVYVFWPDGSGAVIAVHPEIIGFVYVSVSPTLRNSFEGLLGNFDGSDANDLRGRDGAAYPIPPSHEQLYSGFGNSWRVPQAESLFAYGPGQTTETFTDLAFPPANVVLAPGVLAQAQSVCEAAGVLDPQTLKDCAFDVAVTQNPVQAQYAAIADPLRPYLRMLASRSTLAAGQTVDLRALSNGSTSAAQWTTSGGTISSHGDGTATLTAPATPGTVEVTVTLNGLSAVTRLTVVPSALQVETEVTVFAGQTTQLTATLLGTHAGRVLNWSALRGSVTPSGNTVTYTAPNSVGDDTVTVQEQLDSATQAKINIHIISPQVSLSPANRTVRASEVIGFDAMLAGFSTPPTLNWSATGGTVQPGLGAARYTAPSQPGTYSVTVSVVGRPEIQSTVKVTVIDASLSLSPITSVVEAGEPQVFQAVVNGYVTPPPLVWTSTAGTLTPSGMAATFTAPRQAGPVTVTVQAGGLQVQAQVTVPELKPTISIPWTGSEAVAFPGMDLSLVGSGFRPDRAVWSATAGTLSAASGTNSVTFTTPSQPGEVSLTYSHALFPDAQVSTTLMIQTPALSLNLLNDQYDLGEAIVFRVQGVPKYLCPRLRTNLGTVRNCEVSFTPSAAGPQAFMVNLDGIANSTVTRTVQANGPTLVINAPRVHGGLETTVEARSVTGQPYTAPLNWSTTGGEIQAYSTSGARFMAGTHPGNYQISATPLGEASRVSVPVEVFLDPITLSSSAGASPTLLVGDRVNVNAQRSDGRPYPVPLTWTATGGTLSAVNTTAVQYQSGQAAGEFEVTASVTGAPTVTARVAVRINLLEALPVLTLEDGRPLEGLTLLSGQVVNVVAREADGRLFTAPLTWSASGGIESTGVGRARLITWTFYDSNYSFGVSACLVSQPTRCTHVSGLASALKLALTTTAQVRDYPWYDNYYLLGETVTLTATGTTNIPIAGLDWLRDGTTVAQTPLGGQLNVTQIVPGSTRVDVKLTNSDVWFRNIDLSFAGPAIKPLFRTSLSYSVPAHLRIAPGRDWGLQMLLPKSTTLPAVTWSTTGGQLSSSVGIQTRYTATTMPGMYSVDLTMNAFPTVPSSLAVEVVGTGLYLERRETDPTGLLAYTVLARQGDFAGPIEFHPLIIGYPDDEIVWDEGAEFLTVLNDGFYRLDQPRILRGHLKNHPEISVVVDFNGEAS